MELLKKLCDIPGVSGCEEEVAALIQSEIIAAQVTVDKMGNVIAFKKGKKTPRQKLLFCAHMDEVGFIVHKISDDGFIKFSPVGGVGEAVLPGERVVIGGQKIPGVIGAKAVHLEEKEKRKRALEIEKLYIDIGASSREEAENAVSHGDFISFAPNFLTFGDGLVMSKALDDRAGCALLIRLLKEDLLYDIYAVFTVQEEVGLRGAAVASNTVSPDFVVAVETTTCADFPGTDKTQHVTSLRGGPALSLMDGRTLYDRELLSLGEKVSKENGVTVQYKRSSSGGNDCGAFVTANTGARALCISVPCRNLHSPLCVISEHDYEESYKLLRALPEGVLKGMDQDEQTF